MKSVLIIFICGAAGLFAGAVSAIMMAGLGPGGGPGAHLDISVENWASDWSIGDVSANPYVRARIARHGLLALGKSEAVYFTRAADDDGRPLDEDCEYRLTGGRQDAGWWSVTLYDQQSRLPLNEDDALSIDMTAVGDAESWSAIISRRAPTSDDHWISSDKAGVFDLTLRLYEPSAALLHDPAARLNPPRIERLGCREAGS